MSATLAVLNIAMASAVFGLLTGTILANNRQRLLEASLTRLSHPLKSFLQSHRLMVGLTPVTTAELLALQQALAEALPSANERGRSL